MGEEAVIRKGDKEMAMKVLITGAAGFVGTNLSDYLIKRGYAVVGIDLEDRHGRL